MSIDKSYLLQKLNSKLIRKETDIDDVIETVLIDLSIRIPALQSITAITIEIGKADYDQSPLNLRNIEDVTIEGRPIKKITYEEYIRRLADQTSTGKPVRYCYYKSKLYLSPTPDAVYLCDIISSNIMMDENSIDLPNYYKPTLVSGVCAEYLDDLGLGATKQGVLYSGKYINGVRGIESIIKKLTLTGETKFNTGVEEEDSRYQR